MKHGIMNSKTQYSRLGMVSTLAMVLAAGMGCSVQSGAPVQSTTESSDQFISVALATAPTFVASTGIVTVTMKDESAEIYINAADSSLMVNGVRAIDVSGASPVTAIAAGAKANITKINVVDGSATTGELVILNYTNGVFGVGTASGVGTAITFSKNSNQVVLKGTPTVDNWAIGANGISITNGAHTPTKDISVAFVATHPPTYNFFLGAGNDVFTSGGNAAVGAAFASGATTNGLVSIYGGAGNDTLVEPAVSTPGETWSGGPGTDTIDYSARAATVALSGTILATHASTALVGTSTAFTTQLGVGQTVTFSSQPGVPYTISAIADATHATLSAAYSGTTAAAATGVGSRAISAAVDPLGVITSGDVPTTLGDPTAGAVEGDIILDTDVILGSAGADQLMGGLAGSVTLNGGPGNDTFCQGADTYNSGTDILIGGGGVDTVDYSLRTAALTVVMDKSTPSGDPTGNASKGEADIIGTDVSNIKMGSGSSTYTGNNLNNTFFVGTGGTSVVNGMAGDDILNEGLNAANGASETFHGGAGTDLVDYSARTNPITATMDGMTKGGDATGTEQDVIDVDVENLYGGTNGDTLVGNDLDNDIEGNGASAGFDVVAGMLGNDTLVGSGPTVVALSTTVDAQLHGNDAMDTAEPGAFNICIAVGTGTPTVANTANCEVLMP
jgi:hemolysin type calcium-binding protein